MTQLNIGARIISPWFEFSQNKNVARARTRTCKVCGHQWPTVEIPLYFQWPEDVEADCCPKHPHYRSLPKKQMDIRRGQKARYVSEAMLKTFQMGGIYRRRACRERSCDSRWTTAEVSPEGVVVSDINSCPRCGGHGRVRSWKKKRQRYPNTATGRQSV